VATHRPRKGLVLMRTDGTTFPNGKTYLELDPSPAPYYIYPYSVTIAGKYAYMISRATSSSSSQHTLWRAPVDGSAALTAVSLPRVGGSVPRWIDDEIAFAESSDHIVITAGSSSTYEDVIAIDGTGPAVNITRSPGNYEERSNTWGYSSSGCQLAISTKGTWVAYMKYTSYYRHNLYVARADGTGGRVYVTSSSNFNGLYVRAYSLKFVDDENLIFTAYGSSSSYGDLFRVHAPTGTVTNVSKVGDATRPYSLPASSIYYHRIYTMWLSPNRKYLYYLYRRYGSPYYTSDIKAVDLSTWTLKDITKGAEVYSSPETMAACDNGSTLFFAAEPKAASYTKLQLFMFDMDRATPAVQLTSISAPTSSTYNYIYDVTPSPDCKHVAFRAGYSSKYDLYTVSVGSTPYLVANLTNSAKMSGSHNVYDYMAFSRDSTQLVWFSGSASNRMVMKMAPPGMGPCCTPRTVYSGTGSYRYWQLFGVN